MSRPISSLHYDMQIAFLVGEVEYITDPIMFGLVFSNKHIAQPFIEHLLGIKIDHLETPVQEVVLSYDAEHKGVRLIWKCSSVQNERRKIMLA